MRSDAVPFAFNASRIEVNEKELPGRECVLHLNRPGAKRKWASLSFPIQDDEDLPVRPQWVVAHADSPTPDTKYEFLLDTPRMQRQESYYTADGETFQRYVTFRRWDTRPPVRLRDPFKIHVVSYAP